MSSERVDLRLPETLAEPIDVATEVTDRNRTEILIEALQQYLDDKKTDEQFRESVVERYLDDQIGFDALARVLGTRDSESIRASKGLLDDADRFVDELTDE
jgi:predicted transcriptional regulator